LSPQSMQWAALGVGNGPGLANHCTLIHFAVQDRAGAQTQNK
jgi:hypothetical protein